MRTVRHKRHVFVILISISLFLVAASAAIYFLWLADTKSAPTSDSPQASNQPIKPAKDSATCIENLPDEVLLGQKLMVAAYNSQAGTIQTITATHYLNGVIVMEEMTKDTISGFSANTAIKPTIGTDQEGGTVQRFKSEGVMPGAEQVAATLSPTQAYNTYLKDASYLQGLGITTNFAPVVDVASATPNPLPGRMFSSDPKAVTTYATQAIEASQKANITPVIKHFPGLGSASGNTDNGPATTDPIAILKTRDLLPYESLASLKPDAMVNNAIIPGLTNGQPAIWSSDAVSLLRSYGYENSVVYTDSLTAQAIPGALNAAALKAWQAGVDVAMVVQTQQQLPELESDVTAIITLSKTALQSGELSRDAVVQSVSRIFARKGVDPCSIKILDKN